MYDVSVACIVVAGVASFACVACVASFACVAVCVRYSVITLCSYDYKQNHETVLVYDIQCWADI